MASEVLTSGNQDAKSSQKPLPPSLQDSADDTQAVGAEEGLFAGIAQKSRESATYYTNPRNLFLEVFWGLYLSISLVPEALALSYLAGINPLQGLYSCFWMQLSTGLVSGRPGMVSTSIPAFAVTVREIMHTDGLFADKCPHERRERLFFTLVLTGLLQILCGVCQVAHLSRLIPRAAAWGYYNAIAILVVAYQVDMWRKPKGLASNTGTLLGNVTAATGIACTDISPPKICQHTAYGLQTEGDWHALNEEETWLMLMCFFLVVACTLGLQCLPAMRLPLLGSIKVSHVVPSSFVGLLIAIIYEWCLVRPNEWSIQIVRDGTPIDGVWSPWHVPDVPWGEGETWSKCLPLAISLCVIGLVESTLTMQDVDVTLHERSSMMRKNLEFFAQGLGNVLSGFFTAAGGSTMIGVSKTKVQNGCTGRLSTILSAFILMIWIWALGNNFMEALPTAALGGVLICVAVNTFYWPSLLVLLRRAAPLYECFTIVVVTIVAATTNLAIGIAMGIIWECVFRVWSESTGLAIDVAVVGDAQFHRVRGSICFANAEDLRRSFTMQKDSKNVVVDFANSKLLDVDALCSLASIASDCAHSGKQFSARLGNEDYQRYMAFCDEASKDHGDPLRRLPLKMMKSLHGRVACYSLKPDMWQEFSSGQSGNTCEAQAVHGTPTAVGASGGALVSGVTVFNPPYSPSNLSHLSSPRLVGHQSWNSPPGQALHVGELPGAPQPVTYQDEQESEFSEESV